MDLTNEQWQRIEERLCPKMAEPCEGIGNNGRLSACLPGSKTFVVWLFVMNIIPKTSWPWFNLAVPLSS